MEIKITDGLGNQLFQYATARSLCIKKNIPHLLLNADSFKHNNLGRELGLKNFNIGAKVIKSRFIEKVFRDGTKYNKILSVFPFYKVIIESGLKPQEIQTKTGMLTSVSGYWQSEYYFKNIRSLLLKEITPKDLPTFPNWINNKNTVAVHVRRTDYLTEKQIGALGVKYYQNAINTIRNMLNDPLFIFFSDDIEWCRKNFNNDNGVIFCEENEWSKDYLQLFLMSKCSHQIIANSSFSWWGAWLNQNPDKIVIRSEDPFANTELMYESRYPKEWMSVSNL